MNTLKAILALALLSACETPRTADSGADSAKAPAASPTIKKEDGGQVDNSTQTPAPVATVSLVYSSLTKTFAPVNGWSTKTIQLTGNCAIFRSKTYCWDDGQKVIDFTSNHFRYGPFTYNYWALGADMGPCWGGCVGDGLAVGKEITPTVASNLAQSAGDSGNNVNEVFNLGSINQVDCVESDDRLVCGTLTVMK